MEAMFEVMSTRSNIKDGSKVLESTCLFRTGQDAGRRRILDGRKIFVGGGEKKTLVDLSAPGSRLRTSWVRPRPGRRPRRHPGRRAEKAVGVVGPSGSGKSTLLRLLSLLAVTGVRRDRRSWT